MYIIYFCTGFGETADVDCGDDGCQTSTPEQANCLPIEIPANDTEFSHKKCLEFVRTLEVPSSGCRVGPREQLNQLTSWLDASHVYGSNMNDFDNIKDPNPSKSFSTYVRDVRDVLITLEERKDDKIP